VAGTAVAGTAVAGTAVAGTAVAGTAVAGTAVAGTAVARTGVALLLITGLDMTTMLPSRRPAVWRESDTSFRLQAASGPPADRGSPHAVAGGSMAGWRS